MKLKRFWIVGLTVVNVGLLSLAANAGELKDRSFTFLTGGSYFNCHAGESPNGNNYPTSTSISFRLDGSMFYPNKMPMTNVAIVYLEDSSAKPCAAFTNLLSAPSNISVIGDATQKYSTNYRLVGNRECFKFKREDLTITFKGHVFKGANEVAIPVDRNDCSL
ncbi:MAG: hypothetical protein ACOYL6_00690 [Bacteriovoracaceae bacterium]